MNFTSNDLSKLIKSKEYLEYKNENYRYLKLWEKIYSRRKDLWLTQKQLWDLSKIPQNKISQLESWTYWEPWFNMLCKLSKGLNISYEYLFTDNISRKTVELYNYIFSKLDNIADRMQYMKIPYFIDIASVKKQWIQISNFEYIRWHYWPFDKKVYDYEKLFSIVYEKWITDMKYIYLTDNDKQIIDSVLLDIPKENWEKLKILSYETTPMKKLWVKIWDFKHMWEALELDIVKK